MASAQRPGLVMHLGVAFAAVAVLALYANLLAENETLTIRTITLRPDPAQSPPAPAQAASQPSVEAEPTDPRALIAAINDFNRATSSRVQQNNTEQATRLHEASRELAAEIGAYSNSPAVRSESRRLRRLRAALATHQRQADDLVALADSRRELLQESWARLEALDARVKEALDSAWTIFGRVVARRSLVALSEHLDDLRRDLASLASPGGYEPSQVERIAASEAALVTTLQQDRRAFIRARGEAWLTDLIGEVESFSTARTALIEADQALGEATERFSEAGSQLVSLAASSARPSTNRERSPPAGTTSPPASGAPANALAAQRPAETASPPSRTISTTSTQSSGSELRALVPWISIAVLGFLLAISTALTVQIVGPVRRLMLASRRMAEGDTSVRVARGGIRELDSLAASFNQMAEHLATAQRIARDYQNQLEATVHERTRQLLHLAEHDPLTELPNRRQLLGRLNAVLERARAGNAIVGVLFLDLDNFKHINDTMGHAYGDRVLQRVAERLDPLVKSLGFSARLGGDEFTVVLERASGAEAIREAGEELVRAFQRPLLIEDREILVSLSIGVSLYPTHGENAETLLKAADAALFQAKASGRAKLCVFSPRLLEAAASRFTTEQALRRAIEHGDFELAFQPEVHAETFEVHLAEALLRWRLPDGRLATPGEFLTVAEDSGLIVELSDWVLRTAVETAAQWHHGDWPNTRVAINVSARQLLDERFVDRVQQLVEQHELPPRCIEIELTEHVLQTGESTIQALRRLRHRGIGIALDDFGTGYSSLGSLEQLPLTRVKLDRSLIAGIDTSARSLAIARAIISLCESLGLEVTAEGIESPGQLALLLNHRKMYLQGFLLSHAVPARDLLRVNAELPGRLRSLLLSAPDEHLGNVVTWPGRK